MKAWIVLVLIVGVVGALVTFVHGNAQQPTLAPTALVVSANRPTFPIPERQVVDKGKPLEMSRIAALEARIVQLEEASAVPKAMGESPFAEIQADQVSSSDAVSKEIAKREALRRTQEVDLASARQLRVALEPTMKTRELQGVTLKDVQCTSSMCRLDLSYEDGSNLDFGINLLPNLPPNGGTWFTRDSDVVGRGQAVFYMDRLAGKASAGL